MLRGLRWYTFLYHSADNVVTGLSKIILADDVVLHDMIRVPVLCSQWASVEVSGREIRLNKNYNWRKLLLTLWSSGFWSSGHLVSEAHAATVFKVTFSFHHYYLSGPHSVSFQYERPPCLQPARITVSSAYWHIHFNPAHVIRNDGTHL
jgi:hypothetical protein